MLVSGGKNEKLAYTLLMFNDFCSPMTSLKICGITSAGDANLLADLGVEALGVNFWPSSSRYCPPDMVEEILTPMKNRILRVGVFVNNSRPLADELLEKGLIDTVQLHGDETLEDIRHFLDKGASVIRAVSANHLPDYELPTEKFALLVDTPAGKAYGGTGQSFDWSIAKNFINEHPSVPVILAGGLNPENAAKAIDAVEPVAIDIASGAESAPGIKDSTKVRALLDALTA
ncbi:phosphoribosylanthranilate isomerase [Akkermansiaceae bacterium]|nr:phosphoribosylanthranilate isomerase [Akkermansiaceae bacterium]